MSKKELNHQVGPDRTRIQTILTKAGRDQLGIGRDRESGITAADEGLTPVDIRRAGFRRLARRTIIAAAVSPVVAFGANEAANYMDQQLRSADQATTTQGGELYHSVQANEHDSQPIEDQPTTAQVRAIADRTQTPQP